MNRCVAPCVDKVEKQAYDELVAGTALFLRGLYETLLRYGKMSILFLDRGPGFIALDTMRVCDRLEIHFIHGTARYPEGRGKIERFNRTALNAVLRNLDRRPDISDNCADLELRLQHWLRNTYNHTPHESLDRKDR